MANLQQVADNKLLPLLLLLVMGPFFFVGLILAAVLNPFCPPRLP